MYRLNFRVCMLVSWVLQTIFPKLGLPAWSGDFAIFSHCLAMLIFVHPTGLMLVLARVPRKTARKSGGAHTVNERSRKNVSIPFSLPHGICMNASKRWQGCGAEGGGFPLDGGTICIAKDNQKTYFHCGLGGQRKVLCLVKESSNVFLGVHWRTYSRTPTNLNGEVALLQHSRSSLHGPLAELRKVWIAPFSQASMKLSPCLSRRS